MPADIIIDLSVYDLHTIAGCLYKLIFSLFQFDSKLNKYPSFHDDLAGLLHTGLEKGLKFLQVQGTKRRQGFCSAYLCPIY